ncbi:MAG: hypothetical protein OEV95_05505 [Gemmatimonadota bacterium]|nr:hypothetical protein [Gemmatimonadota bacterium]MDH5283598.1 hypothetical protein [Gemmatimonadota bacterium]
MPISDSSSGGAQLRFGRRNVLLLGAAIVSLVVGYLWLQAGGTTGAATLLVIGYCVLFPLGIAL